jgi:hypothetical protein
MRSLLKIMAFNKMADCYDVYESQPYPKLDASSPPFLKKFVSARAGQHPCKLYDRHEIFLESIKILKSLTL